METVTTERKEPYKSIEFACRSQSIERREDSVRRGRERTTKGKRGPLGRSHD